MYQVMKSLNSSNFPIRQKIENRSRVLLTNVILMTLVATKSSWNTHAGKKNFLGDILNLKFK